MMKIVSEGKGNILQGMIKTSQGMLKVEQGMLRIHLDIGVLYLDHNKFCYCRKRRRAICLIFQKSLKTKRQSHLYRRLSSSKKLPWKLNIEWNKKLKTYCLHSQLWYGCLMLIWMKMLPTTFEWNLLKFGETLPFCLLTLAGNLLPSFQVAVTLSPAL